MSSGTLGPSRGALCVPSWARLTVDASRASASMIWGSGLFAGIDEEGARMSDYLDYSGRGDRLGGGARMIPLSTPAGTFRVWTKRIGNNPDLKLLLLHGGPGCTHEYFEACDSYLPAAGIEYYYYDQLGSYYSDQPDIPQLWDSE